MRYLYFLFFICAILYSRENPFEPVKTDKIDKNRVLENFAIAKVEIPKIKPTKFLSFQITKNSITIYTKDNLKKIFTIYKPYKIVLDFNAKRAFQTKKIKNIENDLVENIVIGSHKNYYRVAIKLKKRVKYKIFKKNDKLKLEFK